MRRYFSRRAYRGPLADLEVLRDYADEPVLLALADAIYVTQASTATAHLRSSASRSGPPELSRAEQPKVRRIGRASAVLAAGAIAAIVLFVLSLWPRSGDGILDEALTAIGHQPVIQLVSVAPSEFEAIDIESGKVRQLQRRTELLFDPERRILRTRLLLDGRLVEETLETPAGGKTSRGGMIYTCAWIKRNPAEAARLGLECPETAASPSPWAGLDPTLAGFLDSYQDALRTGTARHTGKGTISGRPVDWLTFDTLNGSSQRVAIDRVTRKPLLVKRGDRQVVIESIATVARTAELEAAPQPLPDLEASAIVESRPVDLASTRQIIKVPYQLDEAATDLSLLGVERQTIRTARGEHVAGLALSYGAHPASVRAQLKLLQADSPVFAYTWAALQGLLPEPGQALRVSPFGVFARIGSTYIAIRGTQGGLLPLPTTLALLRALVPMRNGSSR